MKTVVADFARVMERQPEQQEFTLLLGAESNRTDLCALQEGERVILDEGDLRAEGIVFSEMHDEHRYWYAHVEEVTLQAA